MTFIERFLFNMANKNSYKHFNIDERQAEAWICEGPTFPHHALNKILFIRFRSV